MARFISVEVLHKGNDGGTRDVGDAVCETVDETCGFLSFALEGKGFGEKAVGVVRLCGQDLESDDCNYTFEDDDYILAVYSEDCEDDDED